ncbi:hydroxyacid dehydrogenase [Actinoallomurus iriomotensis]|uniref:2-hydroxyacid dehydrogenase n=1 Tax=Actinoallomurus iriomotensis TaxID=478107 RepID=A0A9W6RP80_9ACTN|nr:hydroxyacid dehydrogenase [Actinoallomurus iriomotensis]GLY79094.1 2-hydroxyacid dehydrogenase [Actinoallomurus iriomotensis]
MTGSAEPLRVLVCVPEELRRQFFPDPGPLLALGEVRLLDDHRELAGALPGTEVLVTGWGTPPLDAGLLDSAPTLRLVAHTGASVKPFVTGALWARGVHVTQAGAGMARSVAEVAMAFTLALLHQVHRFDHALRGGSSWAAAERAPRRHEILGCPIGVIGASRTGRAYIELARALGADVRVTDPFLEDAVGLDELLAKSRIVAVHAPALPETRHLLGSRELALMPDGAGLVNTARSWLVDEAALLAELRTGRLDAALDVFDEEPLPDDHPFRTLPNVLLTPHQAAGTAECRRRQGDIVIAEIERLAAGLPLEHAVTAAMLHHIG